MAIVCNKCKNRKDCVYKEDSEAIQEVVDIYKQHNQNISGNIKCDYYIADGNIEAKESK